MKHLFLKTKFPFKGIIAGVVALSRSLAFAQETSTPTLQQSTPERKTLWGGFGYFASSVEQINVGGLNSSLAAGGYGQFNSTALTLGGGGGFMMDNFFIGGSGAWLLGSSNELGGNAAGLRGGYGMFHAGYVVYSTKRSVLYPCLGFGGGGFDVTVSKSGGSQDFSEQVDSPAGMTTIQSGGMLLSGQIVYQFFFRKASMEGFYIGLKGGYKYSPIKWSNSINDVKLNNAPTINMDGVFVTLFFGGGSLVKN